MGHYDDAYEEMYAKERQQRAERLKKALEDKTVLNPPNFVCAGYCGECAAPIYVTPNWGCTRESGCPFKPPYHAPPYPPVT